MEYTGDPFVDAGGAALEYLQNKFPDKSLLELIEYSARIFIFNWNNKIDSLQLNSLITHNSKRGTKEKQEKALRDIKSFFSTLLKEKNKSGFKDSCRICGKDGELLKVGREFYPMSGSGAFVNFHHSHEEGLLICNKCILKLFFLPFMVLKMGGNLGLLHITDEVTKDFWITKTIDENFNKLSKNISAEILSSEYSNPKNALFNIAHEMILRFDVEDKVLQYYYFTNFGSKPICELFILPNSVFRYISKVLRNCKKDWYIFIKRYYKMKRKFEWDFERKEWVTKKKEDVDESKYKNNYNFIFERLLNNISLIPTFRNFFKESLKNKVCISTLLVDYYLKEVKGMKDDQIAILRKLGNAVFEVAKQEGNIKKYLALLEKSRRPHELRAAIINLVKKNYLQGNTEPLITLDDYVTYLFPDGQNWSEIRDILIIYLYELLHKENIEVELEEDINVLENDNEELTEI